MLRCRLSRAGKYGLPSFVFWSAVRIPDGHAQMYCDRPTKPYIPYGSYTDHWQMEQAQSDVERYLRGVRRYSDCLGIEQEDATSEAKHVIREWNDSVTAYNNQ